MKVRSVLPGIAAVLFLACAGHQRGTPPQVAPAALSLKARAEVLDEVIIMRYGRISTWGRVDACSVYQALGGDSGFRERLGTTARSKLTDESAAACGAPRDEAPVTGRWYIRAISRQGPDDIVVLAGIIGESGTHRETYLLDQGYGHGMWRLREVRMSDFSLD